MAKDKPKNAMVNLIESRLAGIHDTGDILAKLWRILLYELNIKGHVWLTLLGKYQKQLKNTQNEKEITNFKSNMTQLLSKDKVSWGNFIKGILILEFEAMDIQITLHKRGKTHVLKLTVDNLANQIENETEEDKENDTLL